MNDLVSLSNETQTVSLYPSSNGDECLKCQVDNCESCSQDQYCGVCLNGFKLFEGKCFNCTLMNCQVCSDHNYCSSCATGYDLMNGKCVMCSYPCTTCNDQGNCVTCSTPYYIQSSYAGFCMPATIADCI